MKTTNTAILLISGLLLASCASDVKKPVTLQQLSMQTVPETLIDTVLPSRLKAIEYYQQYLDNPDNQAFRAQALKRLAGLELERAELLNESGDTGQEASPGLSLSSSIQHYLQYLQKYPDDPANDTVLYRLAKAYSLEGDVEKQLAILDEVQQQYPDTAYLDEVQFRRAEILFMLDDYYGAEQIYSKIASSKLEAKFATKAQYKLGWAQYKQERYIDALDSFIVILDALQAAGKISDAGITELATTAESSFIEDVLKVVSLGFSYTDGVLTMQQRYLDGSNRQYPSLLYQKLAELYIETERLPDAAATYLAYASAYPLAKQSPEFHLKAISSYESAAFHQQVLENKVSFVKNYDVASPYWLAQDEITRAGVATHLKQNIQQLASYYHAAANKSKDKKDFTVASAWYRRYLLSFPDDAAAPGMRFLLAESEFDAGEYNSALKEYKTTAYDYPAHDKSAEAGYAAIITYDRLLAQNNKDTNVMPQLISQALEYSIQFSYAFPQSSYAPAVITKTAETLFENADYGRAVEFCENNMWLKTLPDPEFIRSIRLIYAHSQFELQQYALAEQAYSEALTILLPEDPAYAEVSERLSASVYLQAQQYREQGQLELAAQTYLRAASSAATGVVTSGIAATAKYDAASMYVSLEQWPRVSDILESFRLEFPADTKYQSGVAEKLALSYEAQQQYNKAAIELNRLVQLSPSTEERRLLTWKISEMHVQADNTEMANNTYKSYIAEFKQPFVEYIEVHQRVIDYYAASNNQTELDHWLNKTVKAEQHGGAERTDRTRYIAAGALHQLVPPILSRYQSVALTVPLKASLAVKKTAMNQALDTYKKLMSYQIEAYTTEATYQVADIYNDFAASLMESQRPAGLSEEELEQYEILLEEQAYPFEEKSIDIHAANAARTSSGTYDEWVIRSMQALAELQPIRYAKVEKNELYINADISN